ncbi:hypothetical protein FHS68_001758 [Dyadobacter arcticus]|uniref:Uncharacterized protein n=1 Tax=Dyadobacter arcticus TaxID=1078754 RepID=A0ABX0UJB7_9BACT|nr:hypothetical protein [Dyadobacter arcticus]
MQNYNYEKSDSHHSLFFDYIDFNSCLKKGHFKLSLKKNLGHFLGSWFNGRLVRPVPRSGLCLTW